MARLVMSSMPARYQHRHGIARAAAAAAIASCTEWVACLGVGQSRLARRTRAAPMPHPISKAAPVRRSVRTARAGPASSALSSRKRPRPSACGRQRGGRTHSTHTTAGTASEAAVASARLVPAWPLTNASFARLSSAIVAPLEPAGVGNIIVATPVVCARASQHRCSCALQKKYARRPLFESSHMRGRSWPGYLSMCGHDPFGSRATNPYSQARVRITRRLPASPTQGFP
mmetsp:Transcript_29613/g.76023  ORF Transcript_29613/g.76023 Transcript_29613/m.76023 type:complete len:230 (+) Transcript_29613:1764-2453(+)